MASEVLQSSRVGSAQVLTIDRQRAANAISTQVSEALERALDVIEADTEVRTVIITGAGGRYFCSGGDIKQYRALRTRAELEAAFARPRRLLDRLEALPLPVIAAVNGFALGGGAELMLACDIRLAAPQARIGFPYVRLGLIPGWHGAERLVRACGHASAMQLLCTGEPVSATAAASLGLVHQVVVDGAAVVDAALAFGERLESAAPLALAASKRVLRATYYEPRERARRVAEEAFVELWLSRDHREAEAAFADKRTPVFKGR